MQVGDRVRTKDGVYKVVDLSRDGMIGVQLDGECVGYYEAGEVTLEEAQEA